MLNRRNASWKNSSTYAGTSCDSSCPMTVTSICTTSSSDASGVQSACTRMSPYVRSQSTFAAPRKNSPAFATRVCRATSAEKLYLFMIVVSAVRIASRGVPTALLPAAPPHAEACPRRGSRDPHASSTDRRDYQWCTARCRGGTSGTRTCCSTAPMSQRGPNGRPRPRWSIVRFAPFSPRQPAGLPPSTAGLERNGKCVSVEPPLMDSGGGGGEFPMMSEATRPVQPSVLPIRLYPFESTGPEQSVSPGSVTVLPATIEFRSTTLVAGPGLLNPPPARRAEFAVMVTLRRSVVPSCA